MNRMTISLALAAFAVALALPAAAQTSAVDAEMEAMLDTINAELAAAGMNYRAGMVEYLTLGCEAQQGNTVVWKDVGNQRAEYDFVPFDNRRSAWSGPTGATDDITYAIDRTGDAVPPADPPGSGLTAEETDEAIVRAMMTWDLVNCSYMPLVRNDTTAAQDIRYTASFFFPPFDFSIYADIQHAGWGDLPLSGDVVSATFTYFFVDGAGNPTDFDNNGRFDTSFREIYYDDNEGLFGPPRVWVDDPFSGLDVESVALHEAGHGLSQGHFGMVSDAGDGSCEFAPRAVMNAAYDGPLRALQGSDEGGHCGNWANWPSN